MSNNQSYKIAKSVLNALLKPEDVKELGFCKAVIMCGLPGSGKSTIARLLGEVYGFERFSSDQIRTEELFKGQEHRWAKQQETVMTARYVVYEELAKRVGRALAAGKRVVVDGTNLDDKRLGVLGSILTHVPSEQVAMVASKPPEWIMRQRFVNEGVEAKKKWWSVFRYWRDYMKEGKASFPSAALFPRIKQMTVRRYAIQTFDWVPDIKAVVWDLDGTLYQDNPEFFTYYENLIIDEFSRITKLSGKKAKEEFYARYKKLGSKTKVLESTAGDGRGLMTAIAKKTDYTRFLKKDSKLETLIQNLSQVRHFILSNASREATVRKLAILGLKESDFEKIYATYDLPYDKPDPSVFKLIARDMKLKPKQVLMVGDREETDIIPAKKVGMLTAFVWGTSRVADVSFKSVYEVAELFGVEV